MDFEKLITERKENDKLAIVGVGNRGRQLISRLKLHGIDVNYAMDNNDMLWGSRQCGVSTDRLSNNGVNCMYIITPADKSIRKTLEEQLFSLGVTQDQIVEYDEYEYYKTIYSLGKCQEELSELYRNVFSRELNWENPSRYTEILNWEKLNVDNPLKAILSDKIKVREWVSEKIGERYLIKRYHQWDRVEDIDFDKLPDQFVLKLNNGSGRNIIVKDKARFDVGEAKTLLSEWMSQNYAFCNGGYEIQYKDIVPKIVCEEYLESVAETVYDYNIYCFHGEPKYIWCIKGSHRPECQASFYDKDWNMQEFSFGYPKDPVIAPKPEKLDEMLEMSTILCKGFPHVRVDWYNLPDGRVLFGEMTFTPWSGLRRFKPDKYDDVFGQLVRSNMQ